MGIDMQLNLRDLGNEQNINTIEQVKNVFVQNLDGYILQVGYANDTDECIDDRMILLAKKRMQITL